MRKNHELTGLDYEEDQVYRGYTYLVDGEPKRAPADVHADFWARKIKAKKITTYYEKLERI